MSFKEYTKNGSFCAFIPQRLAIEGRPELNNFSLNVFFAKLKSENEKLIKGSALYEPDLMSLKKNGNEWAMNYHNIYGGDCWLSIVYDEVKQSYIGQKFINGKSVITAFGVDWNMFFVHFTMLGLADGEYCLFGPVSNSRNGF